MLAGHVLWHQKWKDIFFAQIFEAAWDDIAPKEAARIKAFGKLKRPRSKTVGITEYACSNLAKTGMWKGHVLELLNQQQGFLHIDIFQQPSKCTSVDEVKGGKVPHGNHHNCLGRVVASLPGTMQIPQSWTKGSSLTIIFFLKLIIQGCCLETLAISQQVVSSEAFLACFARWDCAK